VEVSTAPADALLQFYAPSVTLGLSAPTPQDPSTSSQEEQKTHFAPATNAQLLEGWERYFVSPSQSATDTADRPFGFARRRRFERPHLTVAMASNVQDRALGPRVSALPARLPGWPPRPPPVLVFALRELSWKCPCIAEQAVVPNAIPAERARFSIACHQKPPSTTGHQHGRPTRTAVETGGGQGRRPQRPLIGSWPEISSGSLLFRLPCWLRCLKAAAPLDHGVLPGTGAGARDAGRLSTEGEAQNNSSTQNLTSG